MAYNAGNLPEVAREKGKLGGRPRGRKTKEQMLAEVVREEYKQMVLADVKRLYESQSTLAHGQTFLFRIDKIKIGKKKYKNADPKLVTNPEEMSMYLAGLAKGGDVDDDTDPSAPYYFLTAKEPNGMVIGDMLDRAIGPARKVVGLEGPKPGSAVLVNVEVSEKQYERVLTEEFNRIGAGAVAGIDGAPASSTDTPQGSA